MWKKIGRISGIEKYLKITRIKQQYIFIYVLRMSSNKETARYWRYKESDSKALSRGDAKSEIENLKCLRSFYKEIRTFNGIKLKIPSGWKKIPKKL